MYEAYLRMLLSPLGVYDLSEDSVSGAELHALGVGLDAAAEKLETAERESLTATAEDEGLNRRETLFVRRPAAAAAEDRRAAIAALLQIDGDSLTPEAINRTIRGCGVPARAEELGGGMLRVTFPGIIGVPDEFAQIQSIILDILPCHLETEFYFRYLTWAECEQMGYTWMAVEAAGYTWYDFQTAVPEA